MATLLLALLAGCAGPRGGAGRSGHDGPPANPPSGLMQVPDAVPHIESVRSGGANKPYTVLGRSYSPLRGDAPYDESGLASWYGRKFQGLPTASGERYDMYAMTAAHPTLPIPSYAQVRNPANGREVIVRINDRGPFHEGRVIDLSYAAALRLGLLRGVAPVEVHRITDEEIRAGTWQREEGATAYAQASRPPAEGAATTGDNSVSAAAVEPVAYAPASVAPSDAAPADSGWTVPITVRGMPPAPPTETQTPIPPRSAPASQPVGEAAAPATSAATVETIPVRQPTLDPSDYAARHPVIATPLAPMQPLETSQPVDRTASSSIDRQPTITSPAAITPAAQATSGGGFWLQLGAFGRLEGAQQVQRNAEPSARATASRVEIFDSQGLHRVQLGPFASRDAAEAAAMRLRNNSSFPDPVVVQR